MVAQINLPTPTVPLPMAQLSLAYGSLQVCTAPQRHLYSDMLAKAIRTAGQGFPVLVLQLFQGGTHQTVQLCQHLTWLRCATDRDLTKPGVALEPEEQLSIQGLWELAKQAIITASHRLVVIEGLDLAIEHQLLSETEVIETVQNSPVDIVILGQNFPPAIWEIADQVTKIRQSNN
jgi:ATP:corrinoid adenosyltransferase